MRALVIALLLVNLAFFGWARWIDAPPVVVPAAAIDASIPLLQLEPAAPAPATTPATAAVPASAAAVPASAAAVPSRCRSIGPFADPAATTAAATLLRSHGVKSHERSGAPGAAQSIWVYIGEMKDAADQRRAIERLNGAGIHDVAVVTDPNATGRVSVGIFTDQAHAMRRAEQVRQLGFKPVLELHTLTEYWLDVTLKLSDPDPSLEELSGTSADSKSYAKPALNISDCPAKGASG